MEKTAKLPLSITLKNYLIVTKPGIIFGNLVTASAGFALASRKDLPFSLFFYMLFGLSFVIGSACICNNYIDKDLDSKMARTQNRPLVLKTIPDKNAIIFAFLLLLMGLFLLFTFANLLTAICALFGFVVYVFLYSFSKYQTSLGTLIGSFAGAAPPVVGYCSVKGKFDLAALLIFLVVVMWQMPHFYAIAIYRLKDYALGSIPVLPIHKGMLRTKIHMCLYVILYLLASYSLSFFGFAHQNFGIVMTILALFWLVLSIKGFKAIDDILWARKMFLFSLVIVMAQSILLALCVNE